MEQASRYISIAALVIVVVSWFAFVWIIYVKRPAAGKDAVKEPKSLVGLILQGLSYALVWGLPRLPMFSPFVGGYEINIAFQILAVSLSIGSVLLTMAAIRELGRQWSLEARLIEGHKLVMTGPYSYVRHPIYTSMFGKLIATGIVLSNWGVLLIAVVLLLIGTLIRTRFEERLLSNAFGEEFREWKQKVPGLLPFLKL